MSAGGAGTGGAGVSADGAGAPCGPDGPQAAPASPALAAPDAGRPPLATCPVCPRRCRLAEGQAGFCRARAARGGEVACAAYGRLTSAALDPVEKKPLAMWRPGSLLLSVGSYGCNMACPFCQNSSISMAGEDGAAWAEVPPGRLVARARALREADPRVAGLAFTYNEPLVCWEYVRDCALLAHEAGLAVVLVSNGMALPGVVGALAGLIDAANIDLKAADQRGYGRLGGDLACVQATIRALAADPACHLEVTTLVVPGLNDGEGAVRSMAGWLAGVDPGIPYHLTRFFPRWRMAGAAPTPAATVLRAAETARAAGLRHVFTGNL